MTLGPAVSELIVGLSDDSLGPPTSELILTLVGEGLGPAVAEEISIPDNDHLGPPVGEALPGVPTGSLGPPVGEFIVIVPSETLGPPLSEVFVDVVTDVLGPPITDFMVIIPSKTLGPPVTEELVFITGLYPHLDLQTLCPEFPVVTEYRVNVLQEDQEKGRSLRRLRNNLRQRGFEFSWSNLLDCNFEILKAFVKQVKGQADLFTIIKPGEVQTRLVRFDENAFSFRQKNARHYEVTIKLREALCVL